MAKTQKGQAMTKQTRREAERLRELLDEMQKRAVILSDELHEMEGRGVKFPPKLDKAWECMSVAIEDSRAALSRSRKKRT